MGLYIAVKRLSMLSMLKRGVLVTLFVILLAFSVSAAENFSAQAGYDWLAKQSASDGAFSNDAYLTSLSILALDQAGYDMDLSQEWLYSQIDEDSCWPSGSCTVIDTSAAVMALEEAQDSSYFDLLSDWYDSALENSDLTGGWYLEAYTSSSGSCLVSYEIGDELKEVEISVEEGAFPDCGGSNFLDLDECIQSNLITTNPGILLDIDC